MPPKFIGGNDEGAMIFHPVDKLYIKLLDPGFIYRFKTYIYDLVIMGLWCFYGCEFEFSCFNYGTQKLC
jgi:hypothetical protein